MFLINKRFRKSVIRFSENDGTLKYVPDSYKNKKKMWNKAVNNCLHEFVLEYHKTQKMCDKAACKQLSFYNKIYS